jgi:hypothetical protein
MVDAVKMLERFIREYDMAFEKALECVSSYTMLPVEILKKAWHEKHEEEK